MKKKPGCLGNIGGEILPSYVGIITDHYKDPVFNQPGFHGKYSSTFSPQVLLIMNHFFRGSSGETYNASNFKQQIRIFQKFFFWLGGDYVENRKLSHSHENLNLNPLSSGSGHRFHQPFLPSFFSPSKNKISSKLDEET